MIKKKKDSIKKIKTKFLKKVIIIIVLFRVSFKKTSYFKIMGRSFNIGSIGPEPNILEGSLTSLSFGLTICMSRVPLGLGPIYNFYGLGLAIAGPN